MKKRIVAFHSVETNVLGDADEAMGKKSYEATV